MGKNNVGRLASSALVPGHSTQVTPFERRERRARFLAESYPNTSQILLFYAEIAAWQNTAAPQLTSFKSLPAAIPSLCRLVARVGSAELAETASQVNPLQLEQFTHNYWRGGDDSRHDSDSAFFALVLLQAYASGLPEGLACPWCTKPPLAGCLIPQGDGQALQLICAVCLRRRPFPRAQCPACLDSSAEKLVTYAAPDYPHLRLQACEACSGYLLITDLSRDPAAVPEVDELAALPLNLWATLQGYTKLQPNFAGV
jgi:formate dehydrogenase maturation protein FdhE